MMKRSLSSKSTVFFKFFPAFWIPFFGLGVLGAFLGVLQGKNGEPPSLSFLLLILVFWIGDRSLAISLVQEFREACWSRCQAFMSLFT